MGESCLMADRSQAKQSRKASKREVSLLFDRFDRGRTTISAERLRALIEDNYVSCSVAGPCTEAEILLEVCRKSSRPISIDCLASDLHAKRLPRGSAVFP